MINWQSQRDYSSGEPERIVVQVNKDGTVNKRVEKVNVDERVKATVGKLSVNPRELEAGKQTEPQGRNVGSANRARVATSIQAKNK
jgi:hypothetical protein